MSRLLAPLLFLLACTPPPPPPLPPTIPESDGGFPVKEARHGVHGMILFGGREGSLYLSHIPMFRPPHDAQLVLELARPESAKGKDFGAELYTFEPKPASLDAILSGKVKRLEGTLYRGNMEQGGQPVDKSFTVDLLRVVYARDPLRATDPAPPELEYLLVGSKNDAYMLHVVRHAPDFDQLVRVKIVESTISDFDLSRGIPVMATGKNNDKDARLRPGAGATLSAPGRTAKVSVERELSCLVGPEFDKPCGDAIAGPATFDDDVTYLEAHGGVVTLTASDGGRVAVSPKFQGRVMTSAVAHDGPSLGWIHRKFIDAGKTGTQFDNYGGEDRFWLGPEAGPFGLYFPAGKPFKIEHWQTPGALQEGEWTVKSKSDHQITLTRDMKLTNYAGTVFELAVERTVRVLERADVEKALGGDLTGRWVAFEVTNTITNTGKQTWTKDKGLLSIWILGMYNPAEDMTVILPFEKNAKGEIVNDRYFGKVPGDRLVVKDDHLLFKCDGKLRSKIGLGPARAKNVLGSYSASNGLLTIVQYDKPKGATDYVNSMWEAQKNPYAGDVVNSYNDGPVEPGKPSLGGFYELETSSPALSLAPGKSATHLQRTFHFVSEPPGGGGAPPTNLKLDKLSKRVMGVSLVP
jgi:hypothetical protein